MPLYTAEIRATDTKLIVSLKDTSRSIQRVTDYAENAATHAYAVKLGPAIIDLFFSEQGWSMAIDHQMALIPYKQEGDKVIDIPYARTLFDLSDMLPDPLHAALHALIYAVSTKGNNITLSVDWQLAERPTNVRPI